MKTPRGNSESSTTSDNTTEFIDIVKKFDVVYNTHNPDYKNVDVKLKVWSQIAEEIGLSVDASKRKWKNLRDSYTKYLRSFRTGTKTSKKYQYWAHAEHMEFLKPYQGPGRNPSGSSSTTSSVKAANDDDETECDLGFQVLATASSTTDEDVKAVITTVNGNFVATTTTAAATTTAQMPAATTTTQTVAAIPPIQCSVPPNTFIAQQTTQNGPAVTSTTLTNTFTTTASSAMVLPLPALPAVPLPAQFNAAKTNVTTLAALPISAIPSLPGLQAPTPAASTQIFPLPAPFPTTVNAKGNLQMPTCSTASSVGCLILEPQLFATMDSFKKELSTPAGAAAAAAAAFGLFTNLPNTQVSAIPTARNNSTTATKIRRVQPSPQTTAINLTTGNAAQMPAAPTPAPPAKTRKISAERNDQVDIGAILQANRDLDANTLFFLSLARTVRLMPTKFQSLAKMRCMRIVSDIELELENAEENGKICNAMAAAAAANGHGFHPQNDNGVNNAEHFVYCMSPSRLENMIDISSDEESGAVNS